MILEYKMDRSREGILVVPSWVECGGFMFNPANKTFVGFSPSVREYKIPDSVTNLTLAQAKTRAQTIHAATPFKDREGVDLTTEQVDAMVDAIVSENDIA